MNPIMFTLAGVNRNISTGGKKGVPPPMIGYIPLPSIKLIISGVTKDSTGVILGSCVVSLFRTLDDLKIDYAISDAITGAYSFTTAGQGLTYYIVAYKSGSPDVSGTTVNTIFGA